MASTYSTNLGLELIGTGDQSGTWGATTNSNLGTLLEQAIVGYATQAVTDSGVATVLAITAGSSSTGRNYVITLTGALTANRTVEVPAVQKPYTFFNNTTGGFSVTVKVTGQTGVTIANGKKAIVYANGTDVIEVVNAPVSEAGTQTLTNKTLTSPTLSSPTMTTPTLGTPASGVLTNATGLPLTTGVTGTLPVANGGTGVTGSTGSGNVVLSTSPTLVTPALGTPASGVLTNATGLPLTTGVTGTLPVANGGTGAATLTANAVLIGNGTSAVASVAPSTVGNVLTSTGSAWASSAPASGGINFQTFTSSGTWTKPSGYAAGSRVFIQVWGGGGSGSKRASPGNGGGGGGGGYNYRWMTLSAMGATETITIGAGGAAQTTTETDGNTGGTTTAAGVSAYGGGGGPGTFNSGGGGGSEVQAGTIFGYPGRPWYDISSAGGAFAVSWGASGRHNGTGYNGQQGGGGGGGADNSSGYAGGTSVMAGAGGTGSVASSGSAGSQPGGGGGGTNTGTASGAGGAGQVFITVFPA